MITLLYRVFIIFLFIFFMWEIKLLNPKGVFIFHPKSLIADEGVKTDGEKKTFCKLIFLHNTEGVRCSYMSANPSATLTKADTFQRSDCVQVIFDFTYCTLSVSSD